MTLRLRLMLIIGVSFSILWGATSVWMLLDVRTEFRNALDERLAASARMVHNLLAQMPAAPAEASATPPVPLEYVTKDGVACEIRLSRGGILARTQGSPQGLGLVKSGYNTRTIDGQQWRSYTLEENGRRVTTADRIEKRRALLSDIVFATVVPFLVAMIGSLLVLWLGIRKGLAPLESVRQALADRKPDALQPVPASGVPSELTPLVQTINSLLGRTQNAIERERRFTGDAAHELRSPLTAIKTHLQVARMTAGNDETVNALDNAEKGVQRLQHTLEQLLTLARVEGPFSFETGDASSIPAITRLVMDELPPEDKNRVRIDNRAGDLPVPVPAILAATALRNLVENALRYSPADRPVKVDVSASANFISFAVTDEGSGLNDAERSQAVQRFWRKGNGKGSGLGLSIVEAIVNRYGGRFQLDNRSEGGTWAEIRFPRIAETALSD
ncbi:ATP-binding protein [Oxalobacteraceae bacterium R-40]|uniref:histidine kinase n=1 Tax=Keguizhuia sedimenti TaxID=3064264 RepID=A0ABU1BV82_9BURK|nr:ATP-binding protein [Oxalobacteraceae bacterium R-40]